MARKGGNGAGPAPTIIKVDSKHRFTDGALRSAIGIWNGLVRRGELDLLPEDLPAAAVEENLRARLAADGAVESARATAKEAVADARVEEEKGEAVYARCLQLVDSAFPHGKKQRAKFFPVGPGQFTQAQLLAAMASGMSQVGLPRIPPDLTAAIVLAQADSLGRADQQRSASKTEKKNTTNQRQNLRGFTREFEQRMRKGIIGYHGRRSAVLAEFGILVSPPPPRHAKKRAPRAVTPPKTANGQSAGAPHA